MEGMIGTIVWFAGNFAPKTWSFCQGQTINIASNTALFSVLGTTFGGNGTTNFQLPDFQGRAAIGAGSGPGLTQRALGQKVGENQTTITANNLPAHTHALIGVAAGGTQKTPGGNFMSNTGNSDREYFNGNGATLVNMATTGIASSGGSQPFNNAQPYLGMNFIICAYGIFPSRN